ncbi:ABC multidrug transporter B [Cladobotryum mycophilum]|uniref:ABC multidrug transporter B n=1 Tax=Cladobotryum mycophilum TaxID=491253 RepID=A0ABR0SDA6_9HYPO
MNSSFPGGVCQDAAFGPAVASPDCRGGFDFTVLFEESIFSLLPSALFLLIAPLQAARALSNKRTIAVRPSSLHILKLTSITVYAALQLTLLILWSSGSYYTTSLSLASSVLSFCATLGLAVVSSLQHRKSPRPSFLLTSYLLVSLIFDVTRARTSWLLQANRPVAAVFSASVAIKAIILVLEALDKRRLLVGAYSRLSREATSSIFSRSAFWWLNSLLLDGSKRVLSIRDLFSINEKLSSEQLAQDLQTQWDKYDSKNGAAAKEHALVLATFWAWKAEVAKIVLPRLCLVAFNLVQPFVIQRIVENLSASDSEEVRNHGYGLMGAVPLVYIGIAISTGFYQHISFRLMTMIRGGLVALIYRKLAESPSTNASDSAAMSLIGADVERICESWYLVTSEAWAYIIQLSVAVWFLQRQLGTVCIAPIVLAILSTLISIKSSTYIASRQKAWLEAIQGRINFTAQILGSMKSVKMLGLSEIFRSMIQDMRGEELDLSKKYRRLSSFNICLVNLPSVFSQFFTFAAFSIVAKVQGKDSFSVSQTVASLSILTALMGPLSGLLHAIPQGYTALACFQRIQEFLAGDSWTDKRLQSTETGFSRQPIPVGSLTTSTGIELVSSPQPIERQPSRASSSHFDPIVVQDATLGWRASAPVLKNISLRVTKDTQLTVLLGPVGCGKSTLLKSLLGEATILNGTVRVNTMQVSFCDQNPWVFNGSVMDNIVGESELDRTWYNSVIKACALDVDLGQMAYGDETNVGSKGVALSGGQKQRLAIARALYSRKPIAMFDDVLSGLDASTKDVVLTRVFGPQGLLRKLGITSILATHSMNRLEFADQIMLLDNEGNVVRQGPANVIEPKSLELTDESHSPEPVQQEQAPAVASCYSPPESQEQRQSGDLSIYKYYFLSLGWLGIGIFATFVITDAVFDTMQSIWLNLWSESNGSSQNSRLGYWLGLFALFIFLRASSLIAAVYMYVINVPKSGKKMHWAILEAAMRAPMTFLSRTDTGALINRFSQDMKLIDMTLPGALVNTAFQFANCLGVGALSIIAVKYIAAVLPFFGVILWFLQRFYLQTSRQLRHLDLEAKAPLYSHVLESMDGIVSIRAYGWQESRAKKSMQLLDSAQKPFYLLLCIQRWLALVLGLIVAALATLMTILAIVLRSKVNPGFLGIALVNMLSFGDSLASLVTFYTSLETSLGAITRVKSFAEDTPSELSETECGTPPAEWPAQGALTFANWSAHYIGLPVLYCINLLISPGEKIAICGRSGSGKSSLVSSILGMMNGSSGRVVLDGIDLSTIPKEAVRQRITCLTQDAFLVDGSVRFNADPMGKATDVEIVAALKKVHLWSIIKRDADEEGIPEERALDLQISHERSLSAGQRQLFCLARAMLRKTVDTDTESFMQSIIESEFPNTTVIMVTHRLSGIHGFDKVAVLDQGVVVEFGPPSELLARADGGALAKLYSTQQQQQQQG